MTLQHGHRNILRIAVLFVCCKSWGAMHLHSPEHITQMTAGMQAKSIAPSRELPVSASVAQSPTKAQAAEMDASRDVAYTVQWMVENCGGINELRHAPHSLLSFLHSSLCGAGGVDHSELFGLFITLAT
jgi:hypothetical protein